MSNQTMLKFLIRMSARFPLLAEKYLSKTLWISKLTEETNISPLASGDCTQPLQILWKNVRLN